MTKADICNIALRLLGEQQIETIDDDSNPARVCKAVYPTTLEKLLREHIWSFATKLAVLAELNEIPLDTRYVYAYQLPNDCLRVIALDDPMAVFRIIERKILCNYSPVTLEYVAKVEDATKFDAMFSNALAYALAQELALSLTHDAKLAEFIGGEAQRRLQFAKTANAQENVREYQPRVQRSSFLEARMGSVNNDASPITIIG
jgi:hypothetical protein